MTKVIVLNADMTILGTTNYRRAIKLIVKGRAEALVDSEKRVHPIMAIPLVIRLVKAIRILWGKEVLWTRAGVATRDDYKCQYCGVSLAKNKATIDHVIPRAVGGKSGWLNTVCACFDCNNKKDNRTPSQAKMVLSRQPFKPSIMEFLLMKIKTEGLEGILIDLGVY